jgi:hypothetical protein
VPSSGGTCSVIPSSRYPSAWTLNPIPTSLGSPSRRTSTPTSLPWMKIPSNPENAKT